MRIWYLSNNGSVYTTEKARHSLRCLHRQSMKVDDGSGQN